jgi:hypothetical protein
MEVVKLGERYFINLPLNQRELVDHITGERLEVIDIKIEKLLDEHDPKKVVPVNILSYKIVRKSDSEIIVGSFMSTAMLSCDENGWPFVKQLGE